MMADRSERRIGRRAARTAEGEGAPITLKPRVTRGATGRRGRATIERGVGRDSAVMASCS